MDDRESGKPQIIKTRAFGEGYDLWKNYLYVQKLAPLSPKLALVLEVKELSSGMIADESKLAHKRSRMSASIAERRD